jgi:hypothetical protein
LLLHCALALLALMSANRAWAADTIEEVTVGPTCDLPYSPYTHETATPLRSYSDAGTTGSAADDVSYVCGLDEDRDGFDDHIESVIADCFAPYLRFDSAEIPLAAPPAFPGGTEPVALYTIDPPKQPGAMTANLRWSLLYSADEGFYEWHAIFPYWNGKPTSDQHAGDTSGIEMRIAFENTGSTWRAHLFAVHSDQTWDEGEATGHQVCHSVPVGTSAFEYKCEGKASAVTLGVVGTHPVIFQSAGKHHTYLHSRSEYLYSAFTLLILGLPVEVYSHYDRADGNGENFVVPSYLNDGRPSNVGLVSGPFKSTPELIEGACTRWQELKAAKGMACECTGPECPPPADPQDCAAIQQQIDTLSEICQSNNAEPGEPAINECILQRTGLVAPTRFVSDADLQQWYPGAHIASGKKFCGFAGEGCDTETDSILATIHYSGPATVDTDDDGIPNYDDLCPLVKGGDAVDTDEDGAADICDPALAHFDRWVGPGDSARNLRAKTAAAFSAGAIDAGWLDTDQDGDINGKDVCPFMPGETTDTNTAGQELAFPAGSQRYSHNGYVRRGNACDPFESTFVKAKIPPEGTSTLWYCSDSGAYTKYVADTVYLSFTGVDGLSSNDPALGGATTYKQRAATAYAHTKLMPASFERCVCDRDDTNQCKKNALASCYVDNGLNGNPPSSTKDEIGWLPLGPSGCSTDSENYCVSSWITARPLIPNYCDPITAKCDKAPDWWTQETQYIPFSWQEEQSKYPGHWPDSDFTCTSAGCADCNDPTCTSAYAITKHPVLFGSEVARNASSTSAPAFLFSKTASAPYWHDLTVEGQERDVDVSKDPVAGSALGPAAWLLQSRRLRSFVSSVSGRLTEGHDVEFVPLNDLCTYAPKAPPDSTLDLVKIILPAEGLETKLTRVSPTSPVTEPRGWALVQTTPQATSPFAALLSLSTGKALPILIGGAVGFAPQPSLLSIAGDLSNVLASGAQVVAFATPRDETEPLPKLLVIGYAETRSEPGTWFELRPVGINESAGAEYVVSASGVVPPEAAPGVLLADDRGDGAVLFDDASAEAPARLFRLDAGVWTETTIRSEVSALTMASYAIHDGVLFRAGGVDADGTFHGDVLALDTRSGLEYPVTGEFPPRASPAFSWAVRGKGLVYGGGMDKSGNAHSDVWWLGLETAPPVVIAADSSALRGPRLTDNSLLLASADDPRALVLSTSTSETPGLLADAWSGGADGWQPRDVRALADTSAVARCPDGTAAKLCAASQEWWSDPGHVACGGTACEPASARSLASLETLPAHDARAVDLDAFGAWVGAGKRIEQWSLTEPPSLVSTLNLGKQVRSVRADGGVIGVSTEKGFVTVRRTGTTLVPSSALKLCGSPLSAEPRADGRWVVATSVGVAMVELDEAAQPVIVSAARLAREQGSWKAETVPPGQCATDASCKAVDAVVCAGGKCNNGRYVSALALAGDQVVVSVWPIAAKSAGKAGSSDGGLILLAFDGSGWQVRSALEVTGQVGALRASGDFVYAVSFGEPWVGPAQTPLFEIQGDDLITAGSHDVPWWAERRDTMEHRARVTHGKVELATVVP